jgi:hypothetical protein
VTLSKLADWFTGLNLVSRINNELTVRKNATIIANSSFVVVDLDKFEI